MGKRRFPFPHTGVPYTGVPWRRPPAAPVASAPDAPDDSPVTPVTPVTVNALALAAQLLITAGALEAAARRFRALATPAVIDPDAIAAINETGVKASEALMRLSVSIDPGRDFSLLRLAQLIKAQEKGQEEEKPHG